MTSFLVELVHCIKNSLTSIYHTTSLAMEEIHDTERKKDSHTQVKQDIQKIDSVLNSLLNFININTPIAKENTLYVILEEILEANEKQLREKNIKIIKKFEKDLPETYIHNEQVRFILHSVLQYAIFSTPRNETIGFLMKALDFHDGMDTKKDSPEKKKGIRGGSGRLRWGWEVNRSVRGSAPDAGRPETTNRFDLDLSERNSHKKPRVDDH